MSQHAGQWTSAGVSTSNFAVNGGPLTLFNASGYAIAFSTLTDHTTAHTTWAGSLGNVLAMGFNGAVDGIPAGYRMQSVLAGGFGITDVMHTWGDALLAVGGKKRTGVMDDFQTKYLTYWTDNGAYKWRDGRHP